MNEMNIESPRYVLDFEGEENIGINAVVDGVLMAIPLDPANRHYAEIMRQVEAGTLTIADAE